MAAAVPYTVPFVSSIVNPINRGRYPAERRGCMSTVNAKPIKALVGFKKTAPNEDLARATAVYTGIKENPTDYPAPTFDLLVFKGVIDTLAAKIPAALDGSRKAIADRNHQREVVIRVL